MLPDRVSNPGPLTYESGALPIALRGPAKKVHIQAILCIAMATAEDRNILWTSKFLLISDEYHFAH